MGNRITPLMRLTALLLVAAVALTTVGCSGNGTDRTGLTEPSRTGAYGNGLVVMGGGAEKV